MKAQHKLRGDTRREIMLATAARRYSQATEPITRYNIAGYARISADVEADRDSNKHENQRAIITDYVESIFPGSRFTFYADRDRSWLHLWTARIVSGDAPA